MQSSPSGALSYGEEGKAPTRVLEDGQSTNDISTDPFPSQSLLDILPELHAQISNLYKRSLHSSSGEQASAVCLSDGILRLAKLLGEVYVLGGLDERALAANVLGKPVNRSTSIARVSYPPKGEIARWAMRAWGSHLDHESIPVTYKIKVAAALIQIMGIVGFRRKRGALLNELLHLSIPHIVQARVVGAAEWGLHPNAAVGLVQQVADDSLMSLLESIADVYGAKLPVNDKALHGWPSLRIEFLRKCISLCEALPLPDGVAHFTSLLFALSGDTLPKEEEIRLAGNLARAVVTGKKRGLNVEANYWDMFVIQGIEVVGYSSWGYWLSLILVDRVTLKLCIKLCRMANTPMEIRHRFLLHSKAGSLEEMNRFRWPYDSANYLGRVACSRRRSTSKPQIKKSSSFRSGDYIPYPSVSSL